MNAFFKITIKNLKLNKKRTIGTILGISFATLLICTILFLFSSFYHVILSMENHVSGYYHMQLGNLKVEDIRALTLNQDIKTVNPVHYIGTGFLEKNDKRKNPFRLSFMSKEVFQNLGYQIWRGHYPEKEDEMIVSYYYLKDTSYQIGDTITVDINMVTENVDLNDIDTEIENIKTKTYKIVGITSPERTGSINYAFVGPTNQYSTIEAYIALKEPMNYKSSLEQLRNTYCKGIKSGNCRNNENLLELETFNVQNVTIKMIGFMPSF